MHTKGMNNTKISSYWKRYLYFTVFIEGGAVMAVELISAKLIAPFFGTSLYVWAPVLAITLGGLATGYFLGGIISKKYPYVKVLFIIIAISAVLVAIMPHTSKLIMGYFTDLERATGSNWLRTGTTVSCIIFLLPPIACFGMVTPLTIRLVTTELEKVGKAAGTVYAISTFGGIITTFLFGFYMIPFVGLKMSSYVIAIALTILPVGFLLISKFKTTDLT